MLLLDQPICLNEIWINASAAVSVPMGPVLQIVSRWIMGSQRLKLINALAVASVRPGALIMRSNYQEA